MRKAHGILLMPFARIGGRMIFPPPVTTRVQTDGSYKAGVARVAATITTRDQTTYRLLASSTAETSTEAEWASIYFGLQQALQKQQDAIDLENDNLGVINGLIHRDTALRQNYARHFRSRILELAAETAWTGVRWIPVRSMLPISSSGPQERHPKVDGRRWSQ